MAEVDGRKPDQAGVGSADAAMFCGPCGDVKASSFCKDCHEYLCSSCTRCHERLDITKHHQLLKGTQFPSSYPTRQKMALDSESFEKCTDHPSEDIKIFCKTHHVLCCVACSVAMHEHCKKDYIPDIVQSYVAGAEYSKLQSDIQHLDQLGVQCQADIDRCMKEVDELNWDEVDRLKKYKEDIMKYLNKREKELIAEMQQLHDHDLSLLKDIQARLKTWQSDLGDAKAKLQSRQQSTYKLFLTAKRTLALVDQLQESLNDMQQQTRYQHYELVKDDRMENILTDKTGVATLKSADVEVGIALSQLKRQDDIKVDTDGWTIYDIAVVSDTRLLVIMYANQRAILVNSQTGGTLAKITLKDNPCRVCMFNNIMAIVTLEGKSLQLININGDSLELGRSFSVNGDVWGVARSEDKIVVSYVSPPGLQVLSMDGTVLHTFNTRAAGGDVFKCPLFIATSADGMVYVSDRDKSTITQLDSNLHVIRTYSDPILQKPQGIISVSEDQMLVCSHDNHRILLLCPSTGAITSILGQQDGIKETRALTYSPSQKKLYVVPNETSGRIQVFQQQ